MTDRAELLRLMDVVKAALNRYAAETPSFDYAQYDAWKAARDAEIAVLRSILAAEGAVFRDNPPNSYALRLAGLRATSTSGIVGAAANWLVQARKAIEARPQPVRQRSRRQKKAA